MEKDVVISVRGLQNAEDGDEDKIELVTAGRLRRTDQGTYHLEYEESELTGLQGTKTSFEIEAGKIVLLRSGYVNSQMVFELGRRHLSMYEIPNGALSVGVNTHKLRSTIGDHGGEIEIRYGIEIDQALVGENSVFLSVREPSIAQ